MHAGCNLRMNRQLCPEGFLLLLFKVHVAEKALGKRLCSENKRSAFHRMTKLKDDFDTFSFLIIYMRKLLDSDWLRAVQFFLNTVQKRGNSMQKKVIKQAF